MLDAKAIEKTATKISLKDILILLDLIMVLIKENMQDNQYRIFISILCQDTRMMDYRNFIFFIEIQKQKEI